jgi:hypothetical protein
VEVDRYVRKTGFEPTSLYLGRKERKEFLITIVKMQWCIPERHKKKLEDFQYAGMCIFKVDKESHLKVC